MLYTNDRTVPSRSEATYSVPERARRQRPPSSGGARRWPLSSASIAEALAGVVAELELSSSAWDDIERGLAPQSARDPRPSL